MGIDNRPCPPSAPAENAIYPTTGNMPSPTHSSSYSSRITDFPSPVTHPIPWSTDPCSPVPHHRRRLTPTAQDKHQPPTQPSPPSDTPHR
ncbi:hypothetical protein BT67DRAFT_441964 [Trichocladium antarcticum]|uniref:Uncharacterized protein n=1 Tax=Trichocladium antarcticum TaxID=1450529 RepID=A0AAN6UJZ1_9PEZI|nr:hypothetical protein BT67DRAFT_441964 [Trichocladium antarcticum]